jgi:hypothetical protein
MKLGFLKRIGAKILDYAELITEVKNAVKGVLDKRKKDAPKADSKI